MALIDPWLDIGFATIKYPSTAPNTMITATATTATA
jgi:hypothetical protein